MGALECEPSEEFRLPALVDDYDLIAEECRKLLTYAKVNLEMLDELFYMGETRGGARPKICISVDGEEWIIKFPSHLDIPDMGKMEYDYALAVQKCGIIMPQYSLFKSGKRERQGNRRR